MALTGDFRGLERFIKGLDRVASGEARAFVAEACSGEAKGLVDRGFRGSHAPDGSAWAKLKRRSGKPLRDTGRLANSFVVRVTSDGFMIGTAVGYAGYHQTGTSRMVARPMLPSGDFPPPWRAALTDAADEALAEFVTSALGL